MSKQPENPIYRVKQDGFHGELFRPLEDQYPGKVLICFSGSDGKFELARGLAQVFQAYGLTALAFAYVREEGLPRQFYRVPIDPLEAAAIRLHDMGYEKAGLWGLSKGVELGLSRFFKGDRGKNKEPGRKARTDSLFKTLEFVSRW